MYPMELYPGPTIVSRSAARRAASDLVLKKVEIWLGVADAHRLTDRQQNKVLLSLSKV